MATLNYGYQETGDPPDFATLASDSQRAYVPDPLSSTVIFYEMIGNFGRLGSSTPTCRMGIGQTTNGVATGSPDELLGYTGTISPSTQMVGLTGGALYTSSLLTPVLGSAGNAYALVLTSANYTLGVGMIESLLLDNTAFKGGNDNHNFYTRSNGSSIPTDPIAGSASIEGHLQVFARGEINVAPNTPTATGPAGTVASTDLTPLMTSTFFDDNITLPNSATFDYVNQVKVWVRRKSDAVNFWNQHLYTATAGERTAHATSIEYAGTALVAGVEYEQSFQHSDRAGLWSAWSPWVSFTINPGGSIVTTAATPTGKQNSQSPGPFVAQWTHITPLNAKAARIVIRDANGAIVQQTTAAGYTLGAQVTNGNNISITFANAGLTALARGFVGTWEMLAQDTANAWSPPSARVPISINATPNIPTNLSPTSPFTSSSLPLITTVATDPDDLSSALTVTLEIKRADTSVVTRTMTWDAALSKHKYQVIATDVQSAFQTWQWRIKAGDGTSESAYGAYQTFIYGAGPTVTVTSPTDEQALTTSTHRITWTVPTGGPQAKKRVIVFEVTALDVPVVGGYSLDTGDIVSVDLFHDISNLRNGRRYSGYVTVTNATPLAGSSLPFQFTTAFTPPTALSSFTADPIALHVSTGSDSILLDWNPSTYPASQFVNTTIYRQSLADPTDRILLRKLTNPTQAQFLDGNPIPGVTYQYEAYQTIRVGLDDVTSASVLATASVDVPHVVLNSALFPESYGVELRAKVGQGAFWSETLQQDRRKVRPVGAVKPRSIVSSFHSWEGGASFNLLSDSQSSAVDKLDRLKAIAEFAGTITVRDFTGARRFMTLEGLSIDKFSAERYIVNPKFSEEYFVEGESE